MQMICSSSIILIFFIFLRGSLISTRIPNNTSNILVVLHQIKVKIKKFLISLLSTKILSYSLNVSLIPTTFNQPLVASLGDLLPPLNQVDLKWGLLDLTDYAGHNQCEQVTKAGPSSEISWVSVIRISILIHSYLFLSETQYRDT